MADVYVTLDEGEVGRTAIYTEGVHHDLSATDELLGIEVLQAEDVTIDGFSATQMQEILSELYLYVDWRWLTRQLATEKKNLWADIIDKHSEEVFPEDPGKVDRWWER